MSELRKDEREALRRYAEVATPGPWAAHDSWAGRNAVVNQDGHPIAVCGEDAEGNGYMQASADRAFIAAFDPPTVLRLLDDLDLLAADFGHCGERGRCLLTIRSVEHDLGMDA